MRLKDFLTLKSGSGILLSGNRYNPDTQYVWIAFNDNKSIVYSDGKKIVYKE